MTKNSMSPSISDVTPTPKTIRIDRDGSAGKEYSQDKSGSTQKDLLQVDDMSTIVQ